MHAKLSLPQDTAYPPLLFQILEDCWQQEYYLRPSAQHLYSAISELSQLTIAGDHAPSTDRRSVLLDSFTLHQDQRVSCCQCYDSESVGLGVCAAVGEEITSTAIVSAQYRPADGKNEVKYMVRVCVRACVRAACAMLYIICTYTQKKLFFKSLRC